MRKLSIAGLSFLLIGWTGACHPIPAVTPTPPTVTTTPRPSPSWQPVQPSSTGAYSDPGIEILGGSLTVTASGADGTPLKGALIRLYGPTMATSPTNENGQATLGPLAVGTGYRLIVEAAGHATLQASSIEIRKKLDTAQKVNLKREAVVSGKVTAAGQPVVGAVVSDGLNSNLTNAEGRFELRGAEPGALTLTAGKSRFQTTSRNLTVAAGPGASNLDLALEPTSPVAYFDSSASPGIPIAKFGRMTTALKAQGWQVAGGEPPREGVWVLISPSQPLSEATTERLVTFVAQGGKLIMFGEWGGFSGFRNPSTNALAHAVGLHFNPDLVRDPASKPNPDWLKIESFQPSNPAITGLQSVQLYQSCSLFGLAPMATWAQTSPQGYRVQDNAVSGAQSVVVAGPFKGGKAIAVADASAFSDDDSDGNGVANAAEGDNLALIEKLFNW